MTAVVESEVGTLHVLNVMAGDVTLRLNAHDPADRAKSRAMIEDMLKRGYAICVRNADGSYSRAKGFDPATDEYIVADVPGTEPDAPAAPKKRGRPKGSGRRVKASEAAAVSVGRSAGG